MLEPLIILVALLGGMLSRALGYPALIGYLAAGFALHELNIAAGPLIEHLAEIGITLMLFTIGLKLDVAKLLETRVWGTTLVHMGVSIGFFTLVLLGLSWAMPVLGLELGIGPQSAALLAFALSFSSTVFVIQTLQSRGELGSGHATLAIGILIVQDLIAVIFLAATSGKVPSLWALGLLLVVPLRPALLRLLNIAGYGELLTLLGLVLAIGAAELSEALQLKGDLGALLVGAMLAGHPKSKAVADNLIQLKDLFLIGFFLSIGLGGWPELSLILAGLTLGILAALKPLLYFPLMTRFHTSPRSAVLAAGVLGNHSEFGLIVISVAAGAGWISQDWVATLSIAIAISFLLAAKTSASSHRFYFRHRQKLLSYRTHALVQSFEPTDDVRIMILGMGRVGTGAYEALAPDFGRQLLGIESQADRVATHRDNHRRVVVADASDPDFWSRITFADVQLIMLALSNHRENLLVAELLQQMGYTGELAAVVRHADHAEELAAKGISAFNLYDQAGAGFASHAIKCVQPPQ